MGQRSRYRWGSSPRMRGTYKRHGLFLNQLGIIPAYAGHISCALVPTYQLEDHPRVCGAHWVNTLIVMFDSGSSPRMRGTLSPVTVKTSPSGIIPAYAGHIISPAAFAPFNRDHPRVCGAHQFAELFKRYREGSSPRMRGTY